MTFSIVKLTQPDRVKLFELTENHFIDFKSPEIKPAKVSKSVSAFANADGGEIYIGIKEDSQTKQKEWRGLTDEEAFNGHVQAIESILPVGPYLSYSYLVHPDDGTLVLLVEVRKAREIVKDTAGSIYLRRGAQNLPVTGDDALERLRMNKGITSFEAKTLSVPVDLVDNSDQIIEFMLEVVPNQEPEKWLAKQLLIYEGLPTVAAVLLFADEPQVALPKQCGIKIYRYRTEDDEGTRETLAGIPETIEGSAYKQIYAAVEKVTSIIQGISMFKDGALKQVTYPSETIHEILTNAVLHRDYSIPDDIHVRIYDNRVEIESPGSLPGHITPKNILDERFSRNGNMVRYINKFPNPPNKDVGEGLNTAFRAMQQLKLKDPEITQKENSVLVTIRHERLASPEDQIMEYLQANDTISNKEARVLCVIREDWRVRTIFGRMVESGLIEKVPGSNTSSTAYRLVK